MKPKIGDAVKGTEEKIWIYQMGQIIHCPEGYIFKDENGNVINATKIVLEKKKKEYPKTYEECYKVLGIEYLSDSTLEFFEHGSIVIGQSSYQHDNLALINTFIKLKLCRDAYWRIAGQEMGLDKPWEPKLDNNEMIYYVYNVWGKVYESEGLEFENKIFAFPTEEMRDAFKENFDPDIEICKELL